MELPQAARRGARWLQRATRRSGEAYRSAVTAGRWFVVAFWVVAGVLVTALAPASAGGGDDFGDLLPADSPILAVEQQVLRDFRLPVLSGTTVVVHQAGGMTLLTRADSVLWALSRTRSYARGEVPSGPGHIIAAVPIPTSAPDVAVTYLYVSGGTGRPTAVRLAKEYAAHFNNQASVTTYVTGFVPAQVAQSGYLRARLPLFEIASVLLILVIVAVTFRSLLAPFVVLGIAGVGYLVYFPILAKIADFFGFDVPSQLEPLLLALLLGVVTDYCVLLFAGLRDELTSGEERMAGVRRSLHNYGAVIAVAGVTVAGGTLSLLAAPFGIFRALGPALAMTVLVGLAVCLTLTPAVMAILGRRLFTVLPTASSSAASRTRALDRLRRRHGRSAGQRGVELLTRRPYALLAAAAVVGLLAVASVPAMQARLNLSFTAALPSGDPIAEGAQLLKSAGLRGITSPTEVLLEQPGVTRRMPEMVRLQAALAHAPGVVRVLGPADNPLSGDYGIVVSRDGDAARFIVIYNTDPLAADAITHVRQLQAQLPGLARQAGLGDARVSMTGQTLIASEVARLTWRSLQATVVTALVVELIILGVYLRALVASAVLLACSALSVTAALGLTTWVFQDLLGEQGLTFYAPFASAVLLIALGSDYNVFAVGSIWKEAAHRPLAQAMTIAVPRTARAITTAGIILAGTFALVAIIPLTTFRQIAFAMSVGLLVDTLLVRPVLTPAVLTLLGRTASWPSHRITTQRQRRGQRRGRARVRVTRTHG